MKLSFDTFYFFQDLSDQQREKVIVELVIAAPNAQEFCEKILKRLQKEQPKID